MRTTIALLCVILGLLAATGEAQTNYPGLDTSRIFLYPGPCQVRSGTGSPEGVLVGNVCDIYLRTDGGAGVLFYRKESLPGQNTGWENTVSKSSLNNWTVLQTFAGDIRHPSFASQTSNWQISAQGYADFRYIFSDELRIRIFSAEETAVYRSALWVTKSHSELSQVFTCPNYGNTATLWVRDAATIGDARVFSVNDWIQIQLEIRSDSDLDGNQELAVGTCRGNVTSYVDGSGLNAGQQQWTFTRASSPDGGTMASASVIPVGSLAIDLGILNANGAVVLSAYDGAEGINAPYVQTQLWTGSAGSVGHSPRCRLGNLRGAYGYSATLFGLACGDPAGTRITIEPTNGIRIMKPDGTVVLQADASGNLSMSGTFTVTGGNAATQTYVDTAEADAVAAAATDATTKANTAQSTAISTASSDATTKANTAQSTAISTAASDATTKANAAEADAIAAAAADATAKANAAAAASLDKVTFLDTTTIKGGMITTGSITANQILAGTITGNKIAAATITADKMSVSSLSAIAAELGTVTVSGASSLSGGNVTVDANGIRIAPRTADEFYEAARAYGFTVPSGTLGMSGSTFGTTGRYLRLEAKAPSGGVGNIELYTDYNSGASFGGLSSRSDSAGTRVALTGSNTALVATQINLGGTVYGGGTGTATALSVGAGLTITAGALRIGAAAAPAFGGALWVDSTYGLVINPADPAGANTYDFTIPNAANSALVAVVPNATDDWSFGASTLVAVPTVGASVTTGICTNASSQLIACPSDARLKQRVRRFGAGLEQIRKLRPVTYNWTPESGLDPTKPMTGFVAQDVRAVLPSATTTTTDGYLTVDDRALIAALVNAVQEQQMQIEALSKELRALKGRPNGR